MRKAAYVAFMAALAVLISRVKDVSAQGQNVTTPALEDFDAALNTTRQATQGMINATDAEIKQVSTRTEMLWSDSKVKSNQAASKRKKPKATRPPAKEETLDLLQGNCAYIDTKLANEGLIVMTFPAGRTIIIDTKPSYNENHGRDMCKVIYLQNGEKLSDNQKFDDWYDYNTREGRALPIEPGAMLRIVDTPGKGDTQGRPYSIFTVEVVTPNKKLKYGFEYKATWSFSSNLGKESAKIPADVLSTRSGKGFQPGIQSCPAVGHGPGYGGTGRLLTGVEAFEKAGQVMAENEVMDESKLKSTTKATLRKG